MGKEPEEGNLKLTPSAICVRLHEDMKRKSTFAAASFVLLTLSLLIAPRVLAEEVSPPNPAVEAAAANALMNVGIKLSKAASREKYDETFYGIAIALARLGRTDTALKAAQWITSGNVANTQSEVLRLAVRRSTILGDIKRAESLIPQITNNNAKADALLTVARAHLRQNEFDAAQKVLFQVTPLAPNNLSALTHTAYLFSQCGNIPVAKRLFDKAEKRVISLNNDYQTKHFEIILLKANFVDQWQSFHRRNSENILYDDVLEQLLKLGQVDAAINAVEQLNSKEISPLFDIAYYIAPKYPEKATALLDKAAAKVPHILETDKQNEESTTDLAQSYATYLAVGYARVNKNDEVQKWLEQLKNDTPPEEFPLAQLRYLTLPFFYSQKFHGTSTFSPHQLLQTHEDLQPYLSKLRINYIAAFILDQFIRAQIAAEQFPQARGNIEIMEKALKRKIGAGELTYASIEATVRLARLWNDAKDQQRCDALLRYIFNASQKDISRKELLETFIQNGLVDEAVRYFYELPGNKQKLPQAIFSELSYEIATAHPNQFPYELLKAKQPYAEARNISKFVRGLTNDLFRTPGEQDFVLQANGSGVDISG